MDLHNSIELGRGWEIILEHKRIYTFLWYFFSLLMAKHLNIAFLDKVLLLSYQYIICCKWYSGFSLCLTLYGYVTGWGDRPSATSTGILHRHAESTWRGKKERERKRYRPQTEWNHKQVKDGMVSTLASGLCWQIFGGSVCCAWNKQDMDLCPLSYGGGNQGLRMHISLVIEKQLLLFLVPQSWRIKNFEG